MRLVQQIRRYFATWSLQRKILVPLLTVVVVIMTAVGYVQYLTSAADLIKATHGRATTLLSFLSNVSGTFITNYDLSALERFVEHSMKDSEVIYVVFYDEKNKPMTEKVKKPENIDAYLNISEEIKQEGKVIGKIELGYSQVAIQEAKQKGMIVVFSGIGVAVAIIFGLMWYATRSVANSVNYVSSELALTGKHLLSSAQDMSSSSAQLTATSGHQSSFVEKTATTVNEFEATLVAASANVQKSATLAKESESSALKGKEVVNELLSSFELIHSANEQLNQHIQNNLKNLNQIVKVIEDVGAQAQVINNIVFQTKLLSFNASVEAARAGEHGRGFSIVAEEVRKLAEMSGQAAQQITGLLASSIQQVTDLSKRSEAEMSATSKETTARISAGTEGVHRAREAFDNITKSITLTASVSDEIARAVKEQTDGIREINAAIQELSSSIGQTKTVSESQSRLASELLIKSEELDKVTNELRAVVQGAGSETASVDAKSAEVDLQHSKAA